jgi:hypothetical protein
LILKTLAEAVVFRDNVKLTPGNPTDQIFAAPGKLA